jgi:hypothetical protein
MPTVRMTLEDTPLRLATCFLNHNIELIRQIVPGQKPFTH